MASAGKGGFKTTGTRQKKAAAAVKTANRKDNQAKTTAAREKTRAKIRSTGGAGATTAGTTTRTASRAPASKKA
jgi:hypothetical protein